MDDKEFAIEVIDQAADLLDKKFIKGSFEDHQGNVCSVGALCKVLYGTQRDASALFEKNACLASAFGDAYEVRQMERARLENRARDLHTRGQLSQDAAKQQAYREASAHVLEKVVRFNDSHLTTKQDVLTKFGKAKEYLQAELKKEGK